MNTSEARAYTVPLRAELEEPGARCSKLHGLHLIGLVEGSTEPLDEARAELRRRDDLTTPYERLVEDWNTLVNGLGGLGIDVWQPAGMAWHWRFGDAAGSEPTIPAAYLAALRAADDIRDRITQRGCEG